MGYELKYFDPAKAGGTPVNNDPNEIAFNWTTDGRADVYVFSRHVTLALNVALAAQRPLLVAGEPGSGKTRLATAVAEVLNWQYYQRTVTSRTQATDLLWTFDALRRLNDATTPGRTLLPERLYVEPGQIWWGFDPTTAAARGLKPLENPEDRVLDPSRKEASSGAVVLIDEIDKADPDVPNDLLEPFDGRRFTVKETNDTIEAKRDVFLVLTSNGERALPPAFLRRCVMLVLAEPNQTWFERVAGQHFPRGDGDLHRRVAAEVQRLRNEAKLGSRKPSVAEFLDALRVCAKLRIDTATSDWNEIIDTVLLKSEQSSRPQSNSVSNLATVLGSPGD
jgi:MoxR-like ATPase